MKKIKLLLLLSSISLYSIAQKSIEIGPNIGFTSYLGDLKSENFSYRLPGFAHGFVMRKNMNPFFSVKGFFNVGRIHSDDSYSSDPSHRARNLSFRSDIIELGVQGEYNILPYDNYNPFRNLMRRHFNCTPYLFAGINAFHFNPKARYGGSWVALQPLHTEGQNTTLSTETEYARTQFALPFGMGTKLQINSKMTIGVEIGFRKTFTDYLDDVSGRYVDLNELAAEESNLSAALSFRGDEINNGETFQVGGVRGNPDNKDWYLINTISFAYKLYKRNQ